MVRISSLLYLSTSACVCALNKNEELNNKGLEGGVFAFQDGFFPEK